MFFGNLGFGFYQKKKKINNCSRLIKKINKIKKSLILENKFFFLFDKNN